MDAPRALEGAVPGNVAANLSGPVYSIDCPCDVDIPEADPAQHHAIRRA